MPPSKKPKERQPWLKRVLIPFWVFQSLFMLILIGVNAWEITEKLGIPSVFVFSTITKTLEKKKRMDADRCIYRSTTLIVMSFASVCMLLIIIEIVSFARRRLHPLAYLIYQVLKSTLWLTLFCISMVGIARNIRYGGAELYLLTGFIEIVVVLICFIGTLIYASIIYHRHRHRIPYHRSHQKNLDTETARYRGPFSDPAITT
ncbi:MAG: hypothetical protein Q9194_002761, partial [Teloschistes cf. exilis]